MPKARLLLGNPSVNLVTVPMVIGGFSTALWRRRLWFLIPVTLVVLAAPPVWASGSATAGEAGENTGNALEKAPGNDGRRTIHRFPNNALHGVRGLFKEEHFRALLAGAAVAGVAAFLDDPVRDEMADKDDEWAKFASDYLGPVGLGAVTVTVFVSGRYSNNRQFRDTSYDLGVASVTTLALTAALKLAIERDRPNGDNANSFPSGHTSNAFALASVVDAHHGKRFGIPAYAAASLIGVSRLTHNVHWLSDVVAGAALGHFVGRAVVRRNNRPLETAMGWQSLDIMPGVGPSQVGVFVGMNF